MGDPNRRSVLQWLAGAALLAGCGGGSTDESTTTDGGTTGTDGGTTGAYVTAE